MKTLYDKLGVTRHASYAAIEQSYRDSLNTGSDGKPRKKDLLRLQQLRHAYLTLSSPSRRLEYDLHLDEMEHARLRRIERAGTAVGLMLLLAGLALLAQGYYKPQHSLTEAVRTLRHEAAVLASRGTASTHSQEGERRPAQQ